MNHREHTTEITESQRNTESKHREHFSVQSVEILCYLWLLCGLCGTASAGLREEAQVYRKDGLGAQQHGDLSGAATFYQKAIQLDPGFAIPYNDLGIVYERRGQLQMALKAYQQALAVDPNYLEASANLGSLYRRLGYAAQALPYLIKAAVLLEQRRDFQAAKRFYQEVLDVEPTQMEALAGLAGVYERLGEGDQAVTTWMKVALLYEQRGQLEAAKSSYERAVALDATSIEATTNLAVLCERLGQRDQAVFNWVKVGGLYEQRGDFPIARRSYERALDLSPNSVQTLAGLAVVSERLGDREQAVAYWIKCQQLSSPNDPWRLQAEERLVDLGVVKTGSVYRRRLVEQEFQTNTHSLQQFRMVTDREPW